MRLDTTKIFSWILDDLGVPQATYLFRRFSHSKTIFPYTNLHGIKLKVKSHFSPRKWNFPMNLCKWKLLYIKVPSDFSENEEINEIWLLILYLVNFYREIWFLNGQSCEIDKWLGGPLNHQVSSWNFVWYLTSYIVMGKPVCEY